MTTTCPPTARPFRISGLDALDRFGPTDRRRTGRSPTSSAPSRVRDLPAALRRALRSARAAARAPGRPTDRPSDAVLDALGERSRPHR